MSIILEQGRIHSKISQVRLGRSSHAKAAQKTPKKQMRYQPTDIVMYRVACTQLKIMENKTKEICQFFTKISYFHHFHIWQNMSLGTKF